LNLALLYLGLRTLVVSCEKDSTEYKRMMVKMKIFVIRFMGAKLMK
jgi:hypothetical protein